MVKFENVEIRYGDFVAINDLNLEIKEGEFFTFLGPSGCGKTTSLRALVGFITPSKGKVIVAGKDVTNLPVENRNIGMVFQSYELFPTMTVYENIAFGMKVKKLPKAEIDRKIREVAKKIKITDEQLQKNVSELSGGQQQRVALARAIVLEPKILCLDEPLSNLDAKLRIDMRLELKRLQKELGITTLYVTHDQEEALTMSDKIIVMNKGYIQQMGTPEDIYNEPENAFVADFIGDSNIIDGIMLEDRLVEILGTKFPCVDEGFGKNRPVDVVIRPEDVVLKGEGEGIIDGIVTSLIFKGVHYEMEVEANGYEWLVHSTNCYPVGSRVSISVIPFNIQIMHKPESEDEKAVVVDE